MISKISIWAKGIVIAVIIGTVIELILPENKNKKYVKVVIGVYVLFCIISPVIGSTFNINEIDMEKYLFLNETQNNQNSTSNDDETIKKIFKENMNSQIRLDLQKFGYDSNNIKITTDENYNIIAIDISDVIEYKDKNINVNTIEINIKDKPAKGIPTSDRQKIIEYFKTTYNLEESNIKIT